MDGGIFFGTRKAGGGDAVRITKFLREERNDAGNYATQNDGLDDDDFVDSGLEYEKQCRNTNEKKEDGELEGLIAQTIELPPSAKAIYTLNWGLGDGTTQARVLRAIHEKHGDLFSTVSVSKEFDGESALKGFLNLAPGLIVNRRDVIVISNMGYHHIAGLNPGSAENFEWLPVPLKGDTAAEFQAQIVSLKKWFKENWQFKPGTKLHDHPAALVAYREEEARQLEAEGIIPQKGGTIESYNFVDLTQAYRLSRSVDFKVERVLAPGLERLAPGGVGVIIQAAFNDHGREILRSLWPEFDPFKTSRPEDIIKATLAELTKRGKADGLKLSLGPDIDYQVRQLHVDDRGIYNDKALRTVFDAVVYHFQQNAKLAREAVASSRYRGPTREALLATEGQFPFVNSTIIAKRARNWNI